MQINTQRSNNDGKSIMTGHGGSNNGQDEKGDRGGMNSLFIPLGSDNGLVEVSPLDNAAIIAQALSSNLYKETLIENNYLDFAQKA